MLNNLKNKEKRLNFIYLFILIDVFNKIAGALIELKKNYEMEYCNFLAQPFLGLLNLRLQHSDVSVGTVENVSNKYISIFIVLVFY